MYKNARQIGWVDVSPMYLKVSLSIVNRLPSHLVVWLSSIHPESLKDAIASRLFWAECLGLWFHAAPGPAQKFTPFFIILDWFKISVKCDPWYFLWWRYLSADRVDFTRDFTIIVSTPWFWPIFVSFEIVKWITHKLLFVVILDSCTLNCIQWKCWYDCCSNIKYTINEP